MTWNLARLVGGWVPLASARPACDHNAPNTGEHGPAHHTAPRSKPDGLRTLPDLLASRSLKSARGIGAQRLHMRLHLILAKGACSDGH
jgi:hypothetical protein